MPPSKMPAGIQIIPSGKSDRYYMQAWAVTDPKLKMVQSNAEGATSRYEFGMKLPCKVGHGAANPQIADCYVNVEV
jgi:hypothetical protein